MKSYARKKQVRLSGEWGCSRIAPYLVVSVVGVSGIKNHISYRVFTINFHAHGLEPMSIGCPVAMLTSGHDSSARLPGGERGSEQRVQPGLAETWGGAMSTFRS